MEVAVLSRALRALHGGHDQVAIALMEERLQMISHEHETDGL